MLFDSKNFDLRAVNNQTLSDLHALLSEQTEATRSPEQEKIDAKYAGVYEELRSSLNPKQQKLLNLYDEEQTEIEGLETTKSFILGFKTALRLALEGMK